MPLLSLFSFGILGSSDTSTHMGFVGAFLGWLCDGIIPLLLELDSAVGQTDDKPSLGTPNPLLTR